MSSGCKSSVSFVDASVPVRATYVTLHKWPESDAEFVRSVASRGGRAGGSNGSGRLDGRTRSAASVEVDGHSCRQMYLRSYTFSRKESVHEKTLRCFGRVKYRAVAFPRIQRTKAGGDINSGSNNTSVQTVTKKNKVMMTAYGTVRKIRELSCSTLYFVFHRLLYCAAGVDVLRQGRKP